MQENFLIPSATYLFLLLIKAIFSIQLFGTSLSRLGNLIIVTLKKKSHNKIL